MASFADGSQGVLEVMLEFRAGKMFLQGKQVTPDPRKGLVRIARGEEGLIHFQWLDRVQNVIEDDQIVFPDEAGFEKVGQASGRVYLLKFNTDDRKFFFWMQEPRADGDEQLCRSVNDYLNRPLEFEEDSGVSIPLQADDMAEDDISSRAGNLIGSSMGGEVVSDVTSAPGPVKLSDLQKILSNIGSSGGAAEMEMEDPDGGFGLGDLLKPELVLPLLETLPIEDRLGPFLPEGQGTLGDVIEVLQCPPFRQQVDSFTYVLKTGQIDLQQFGIDPTKYKFSVLSFLEALEDSVAKNMDSDALRQESRDARSQAQGSSDPMDEGK